VISITLRRIAIASVIVFRNVFLHPRNVDLATPAELAA
jgi:hypothetical protein